MVTNRSQNIPSQKGKIITMTEIKKEFKGNIGLFFTCNEISKMNFIAMPTSRNRENKFRKRRMKQSVLSKQVGFAIPKKWNSSLCVTPTAVQLSVVEEF